MNTPAHLLLGAAALGRGQRHLIWAAMLGATLPDLSLYLMAGVSIAVLGIPPNIVFDELYFSQAWQTVFAIDNSFFLWGILFALAFWRKSPWALALTGAALLHLCLDFPLHHDDGRPHFWPLSNWVFESPYSYWDIRHGARWIAPFAAVLSLGCAVLLWVRKPGWVLSVLIVLLVTAELRVAQVWLYIFSAT